MSPKDSPIFLFTREKIMIQNVVKKEVVDAINNDTHRITIQKWKDDGDDCFLLDYADVQKDGTIIVPKDFGRLPKKYRIELKQFLEGGK